MTEDCLPPQTAEIRAFPLYSERGFRRKDEKQTLMNQNKTMPKLAAALAFLAALLLIVSLLFTALQLVLHDEAWFAARYESYGTAEAIGIPTDDITAALMRLIYYMEGDVPSIDLTVMENGVPVSMYNERETQHMVDVRELYQAWRGVRDLGVPAAALLILGACALLPRGQRMKALSKGYLRASIVFGLIVTVLGVWVVADFNSFWINFHYLFFDNDLWILSYATDRMIRICPQQLFYDIVVKFGLIFLAAFGALLVASIFGARERKARGEG